MSSVAKQREAAVSERDWRALVTLLDEVPAADRRVRERLVTGLERIASPGAVPVIERIALDDGEGRFVRVAALEALAKIGAADAVGTAVTLLANGPPRVRRAAAMLLGKLGGGDAERPLVDALRNDDSKNVRAEAAEALGLLACEGAVPELAAKLGAGEKLYVRQQAALALHRIGTPDARARLDQGLDHANPLARWRIRRWIETMK